MTAYRYSVSFWADENLLKLIVLTVAQLDILKTTEWYTLNYIVNYIVCDLHLN